MGIPAPPDAVQTRHRSVMSLADEYQRQFNWRSWATMFDALPPLDGQLMLDLGCAVGDQSAELVRRGARVIGIDSNEALLACARARAISNAEFRLGDLTELEERDAPVDGIWCSFAVAYLTNLAPTLAAWRKLLKPGAWVAITEIDDLFAHEPVQDETRELFARYVHEALAANRYDFQMGRKLPAHLNQAGFSLSSDLTLPDRELSFTGPADPEVVEACRRRLERTGKLREFCGRRFERLRADFLAALIHPNHRSLSTVRFCIAFA